MATAELVVDYSKWPLDLQRSQEGLAGVRHYKVDSTVIEDVLDAAGLPRIGDPWSPQLPLVAARFISRVQTTLSHSIVKVDYSSPRASLFDPGGQSHTELLVGTVGATVFQGALPSGEPDGVHIEGGAPKDVGTLEVRVSAYFDTTELLPLAGWLSLVGYLNANVISLPRVGFTGTQFTMQPDQALYLGFEGPTQQGSRVVVNHRLRLSPSFDFLEARVNDRNQVIETRVRRIYGRRLFTGLW